MTAYVRAYLNNDNSWGGTITLPGFAFKAKKVNNSTVERIDSVFKGLSLFQQQVAYIPLNVSQPNDKQQSLPNYSVYVLLAAIGELLRQSKDTEELKIGISQISQVRSYPMPNLKNLSFDEASSKTVFQIEETTNTGEDLGTMIKEWLRYYPRHSIVPHLLGKIATRIFYAFRTIEDNETFENLGESMHYRIIMLLNSILLEDARENIKDFNLNNNNPNISNSIFVENLQKVNLFSKEGKANLYFSQWMLSCPLFLLYLNWDDLDDDLTNFISQERNSNDTYNIVDFKRHSIYGELIKVGIKDSSKPKFSATWGFDNTVEILKTIFTSYDEFISTSAEEIKNRSRGFFLLVNINSVRKIKDALTSNGSW
jgi:hypothetical protein